MTPHTHSSRRIRSGKLCRQAILVLLGLFLTHTSILWAEGPTKEQSNRAERNAAFMDWGVGMFIHWSLDSELGSVISHSLVGASDDYAARYFNELPQFFNPTDYDPESWVKLAKLAGFRYVVLTTKHHNGFCLWPTQTTDFSVAKTPYQKDLLRPFVDACRKHDMKVGFYFSPEDFWVLHQQGRTIRRRVDYADPSNNPELAAHNRRQLQELFTRYGPIDVAFLDGRDARQAKACIHELQPDCIVTRGEMATPEQKIPNEPIPGPWESCFTLGTQWQFKPTNESYKSGGALIDMLIDIRAKGGNLLINLGPEPSGTIPFEQERRFRELGLWMFVNREAIHAIRPGPVYREDDLRFTRSRAEPSTVYVFIPQGKKRWSRGERREFLIRSLRADGEVEISVLGQNDLAVEYRPELTPTSRVETRPEGLQISVVRAQRLYNDHKWPNPVVVRLRGVQFIEQP